MFLIVGLGNPGEKFKNTRHNVGFWAVDKFAEKNNFPNFKLDKKSDALVSKNEEIILAKPQTFMNESGKAVKEITTHYKLLTTNLIVVHDDIDLPIGKIKISKDRGSAGHKGIESIIKAFGQDFIRIRIGIETVDVKAKKVVLKKFTEQEKNVINGAVGKAVEALDLLIKKGFEKAMNNFN